MGIDCLSLRKRFEIWSRSLPQIHSIAMKWESPIFPSSKIWQMLACDSCPAILASSMNISMKSPSSAIEGRIRLIAMIFSNPSTPKLFALNTSAIPPTLRRSSSRYFPKGWGDRTGLKSYLIAEVAANAAPTWGAGQRPGAPNLDRGLQTLVFRPQSGWTSGRVGVPHHDVGLVATPGGALGVRKELGHVLGGSRARGHGVHHRDRQHHALAHLRAAGLARVPARDAGIERADEVVRRLLGVALAHDHHEGVAAEEVDERVRAAVDARLLEDELAQLGDDLVRLVEAERVGVGVEVIDVEVEQRAVGAVALEHVVDVILHRRGARQVRRRVAV